MTTAPTALVFVLSNIGDAVMSTAVLEALHAHDPDLRVDVVADARSAELFRHCPYLDRCIVRHRRQGWPGALRLVRELRRRRYALVVDLRTDGLAYLLRADRRLTKRRAGPSGPHAVERHLAVLAPHLGRAPRASPQVWLPGESLLRGEALLGPWRAARCLALAPGANWPGKVWPVACFAALAAALREEFDGFVVVGSTADREAASALAGKLDGAALDLSGRTSLLEAAAVLRRCAAFVGNDSGLGHLAAAAGTPTMTLFGSGEPARYHPWGERAAWISSGGRAIDTIEPARVVEALRAHLRALAG
jgi:ADP-heptose:LPS heptosyltransferase